MTLQPNDLPSDLASALTALRAECEARMQAEAVVASTQARLSDTEALIAHLQLMIEKLKREKYGQRSERTARLIGQMELQLEDLVTMASENDLAAAAAAKKTYSVRAFSTTCTPWLLRERETLSRSAEVLKPINYMLPRWDDFAGFLDDGRICLTTDGVEKPRSSSGSSFGRLSFPSRHHPLIGSFSAFHISRLAFANFLDPVVAAEPNFPYVLGASARKATFLSFMAVNAGLA